MFFKSSLLLILQYLTVNTEREKNQLKITDYEIPFNIIKMIIIKINI